MTTSTTPATPVAFPPGLRRVEVPAAVAGRLEAKFAALQMAQQDFTTACEIALTWAGETNDAGISGIENGPEVFAVIVRDAPPAVDENVGKDAEQKPGSA